jgi:CRP/FNR family cyclic AMP-dependent transcriptional regulator
VNGGLMDDQLDLRGTPVWDRHGLVCSAFSELRDDETLYLIYDYEPRPLRRRFEKTFSHRFVWTQRRLARERWEIALRKLPLPGDARSTTHFMARCPIFSGAGESTRRLLAAVAESKSIARKTTIAEQESDWPYLGLVRRGRVFAIVGTPQGRDQILFDAPETEIFGNIVLFDGGATIARFATLADAADLLLFPRVTVLEAAEADAKFALALAASVTQQVRTIAELVAAHVSKKIIARVAAALRPYAPVESGLALVDPANLPSLRLTQIASAAGTVKEVVARAVGELERAGAIRRVRGRIAFIDRAKLAAFDM